MGRPKRHSKENQSALGLYHITNKGNNGDIIFGNSKDKKIFIDLLIRFQDKYSVKILTYCLMKNHYHLIIKVNDSHDMSDFFRDFGSLYAKKFNKRNGKFGHLCKGRFYSSPINSYEYLIAVLAYIINNPVKAEICADSTKFRWSSIHEIMSYKDGQKLKSFLPLIIDFETLKKFFSIKYLQERLK